MLSLDLRRPLDYCCIMLYDRVDLGYMEISYEKLVELFIRNSLQIPSTSRVKQYFEEHIRGKSAINEIQSNRVREWCRFHNMLKRQRTLYKLLIPLTKIEQQDIKDYRYVVFRILAYEIEHQINGIKNFDAFFREQIVVNTPITDEPKRKKLKTNTLFNTRKPRNPKI